MPSRAVLRCRRCGDYSGWISRSKGGVKAINTTCSSCGKRLRYTFDPDPKGWKNAYRSGRGAHNRTYSVSRLIPYRSTDNVKKIAAELNRKKRLPSEGHDDFGFKRASDL
jgi:hypothetical protein